MPTKNPRIAVTLPPSLDALCARLAHFSRSSKSSVVRELLEAAEPALVRTVALMEAASRAQATWRGAFASDMENAQAKAELALVPLLRQLDDSTADLVRQAERIEERRPARARDARSAPAVAQAVAGAPNPPASNRGVKSTKRATSRATETRTPTGRRGAKR
jgi:hypothetical protein